jgi:hypothetical protein
MQEYSWATGLQGSIRQDGAAVVELMRPGGRGFQKGKDVLPKVIPGFSPFYLHNSLLLYFATNWHSPSPSTLLSASATRCTREDGFGHETFASAFSQ